MTRACQLPGALFGGDEHRACPGLQHEWVGGPVRPLRAAALPSAPLHGEDEDWPDRPGSGKALGRFRKSRLTCTGEGGAGCTARGTMLQHPGRENPQQLSGPRSAAKAPSSERPSRDDTDPEDAGSPRLPERELGKSGLCACVCVRAHRLPDRCAPRRAARAGGLVHRPSLCGARLPPPGNARRLQPACGPGGVQTCSCVLLFAFHSKLLRL